MPAERSVPPVTLALMALCACVAVDLAEYAGWTLALARAGVMVGVAYALARVIRRPTLLAPAAVVAAIAGASFHWYEASGNIASVDRIVLAASWALMPTMLAFAGLRTIERMLAVLSAFAVIVASGSTTTPTLPLVLVYVASATIWLASRAGSVPAGRSFAWVAVVGVVIATLSAGLTTRQPVTRWAAGIIPASGGLEQGSASAREGVGDGPDEASGDNATSAGFDQHDRFSESALDGLYDLWVESFGQPVQNDRTQRMVNLKPEEARVIGAVDRQDLRNGKRFDLKRQPPRRPTSSDAPQPRALLAVEGRTPLHLRLATFEIFDGSAWHAGPDIDVPASIRIQPNDTWFSLIDHPDCGGFSLRDTWRIRFIEPGGSILPMPPAVRRFELGRVRNPSFFRERTGSLIGVDRATLPAGSVLAVDAHTFDSAGLLDRELSADLDRFGRISDAANLDSSTRAVVEGWIAGTSAGWTQIDAVIDQIRAAAPFDATSASTDLDTTRSLIVDGKPGASYHFASAAADVLRALGYRVRLVAGLYVPPDRAEPDSGHTLVRATDAHVWVEIKLATGAWMPLEPTPGFSLIRPQRTWLSRIAHGVNSLSGWIGRNILATVLIVSVLVGVGVGRRWIAEWVDTVLWRIRVAIWPGRMLPSTLQLLERRARRWGKPRAPHQSVRRWLSVLGEDHDPVACQELAALHDRCVFGGPSRQEVEPWGVCRDACAKLGPRVFRRAARSGATT